MELRTTNLFPAFLGVVPAYKKAFSPPSVHHFEELLVRTAPSSVLLSQCLISDLGGQKPQSPRGAETGSDSRAASSASITLNSRHIALHRPGTGGGRTAGTCRRPPSGHFCPLKDVAGIWPTWCSEERVEITHLPYQRLNWNQFVSARVCNQLAKSAYPQRQTLAR